MSVVIILSAIILIGMVVVAFLMWAIFVPRFGFLSDSELDARFNDLLRRFYSLSNDIDSLVAEMIKNEHEVSLKRCEFLNMQNQMENFVNRFEKDVKDTSLIRAKRKNINELSAMVSNMEAYRLEIA